MDILYQFWTLVILILSWTELIDPLWIFGFSAGICSSEDRFGLVQFWLRPSRIYRTISWCFWKLASVFLHLKVSCGSADETFRRVGNLKVGWQKLLDQTLLIDNDVKLQRFQGLLTHFCFWKLNVNEFIEFISSNVTDIASSAWMDLWFWFWFWTFSGYLGSFRQQSLFCRFNIPSPLTPWKT